MKKDKPNKEVKSLQELEIRFLKLMLEIKDAEIRALEKMLELYTNI